MKNLIFYFSGTGNSLQVAKDLAEKIGECEVLNLAKYDTAKPNTRFRLSASNARKLYRLLQC